MDQTEIVKKQSNSGRWFWGILIALISIAILFVGFSIIFFANMVSDNSRYDEVTGRGNGRIAVVDLDFTILSSESIVRQFKKFGEDKSIKAILLHVNTPGGGVAASQEMYEAIKKVKDNGKPVVVSISSLGASGGYYAACGGSLIIANPGSLVGSIGVIINLTNFKDLAEKIGITENIIKSGELKDAGNPFRELNEKDKEYFQDIVNDSYDQFLDVVSKSRKMDKEKLKEYANGRVFTGRQAKEIGLIDSLGTYEDAVKITSRLSGIDGDPVIVKEKKKDNIFFRIVDSFSDNNLRSVKNELKSEFFEQPILQYKFVY